jgi:hypothetical protein
VNSEKLIYLSEKKAAELKSSILENIDLYKNDGFIDQKDESGWKIELDLKADLSPLQDLVGKPGNDAEVANSLSVWQALHEVPASFATENRFWARLSHVECFSYSQSRWLNLTKSDEKIAKQVQDHFFASSLTKYRDDHSIGRLWWNAFVAKMLMPHDQEQALKLILLKADIRSNLLERPLTFSRQNVGRGILRKMMRTPEVHGTEDGFRMFMKEINKFGGGLVFEAFDDLECDQFMDRSWERAEKELQSAS